MMRMVIGLQISAIFGIGGITTSPSYVHRVCDVMQIQIQTAEQLVPDICHHRLKLLKVERI
jgi:hypothetical protein